MFEWISSAFGDDAQPVAIDQRREPRLSQPGRIVALNLLGKWFRMPLLNVSTRGASGEVTHPIAVGSRVVVAFENGFRANGDVRSVVGRRVGIEFEKPLPLDVVEGEGLTRDPVARRRYPRVMTKSRVEVVVNGEAHPAQLENLSAGGAGIAVDLDLVPGQQVAVAMAELNVRHGQVRWCENGHAGIMFAVPTGSPVDSTRKL